MAATFEVVRIPEERRVAAMGHDVVEIRPRDRAAFLLAVDAERVLCALGCLQGSPPRRAIPAPLLEEWPRVLGLTGVA